jgi:hypothetical protein
MKQEFSFGQQALAMAPPLRPVYNSAMHLSNTGCGGLYALRGVGRARHWIALMGFFALVFLSGCGSGDGTPSAAVVGRPGAYDYSPSVIQTGQVQQFWWCGQAQNPSNSSQISDTILYESIDLATGKHDGPYVALAETPGAWDSAYTCNPKVVKGSFSNPLGDGQTYTYALYYVATDKMTGSSNSIGAAFSNDGMIWKKYPVPVIPTTNPNGYGPAQPVPFNSDGKQAITLFYEDDTPPLPANHHWQAVSTDGIHFSTSGLLTTNGLNFPTPYEAWADMAYNTQDGYWYALYNVPYRNPLTTGGVGESGQGGFQVYRIPQGDLLEGKTGWQEMKTFDTVLTGYESLFLPGLLRDGFGNLYLDPTGTTEVFPSFSNARPAWNTQLSEVAQQAAPPSWDISQIPWTIKDATLYELKRYRSGTSHLVTTGWIDQSAFTLESTLGRIYPSPQAGGATVALYSCKMSSTDSFVSLDPSCEGQYIAGLDGYVFGKPPSGVGSVAIYRCSTNGDHFVSNDSGCEGSHTDELLGYILPE